MIYINKQKHFQSFNFGKLQWPWVAPQVHSPFTSIYPGKTHDLGGGVKLLCKKRRGRREFGDASGADIFNMSHMMCENHG